MPRYSLDEIACSLQQDRLAIRGISPEVYTQNLEIVEHLGTIATNTTDDEVLSVQLFGSRASGYAETNSDIDVNVVALNEDARDRKIKDIGRLFASEMPEMHPESVDYDAAALVFICDPIPVVSEDFVDWVSEAEAVHSLFGEGLAAASDSVLLTRLAAMEAIRAGTPSHLQQKNYTYITNNHRLAYLGMPDRTRRKLAKRLNTPLDQVKAVVSSSVFAARRASFGMPSSYADYLGRLNDWAEQKGSELKKLPTYSLYKAVSN